MVRKITLFMMVITSGILFFFCDKDEVVNYNTEADSTVDTVCVDTETVGKTGGVHYVWWDIGRDFFDTLDIYVTIYDEPKYKDGLYFQMYQGRINDIGFYFGFQTDIYKPGVGGVGKGIIFSRWDIRDTTYAKLYDNDGWIQSAGYEGDFIGIRTSFNWTPDSYKFSLFYESSDSLGDWYCVKLMRLSDSFEVNLGAIRFEVKDENKKGIANWGGTWTEIYNKADQNTPIPDWKLSIDSLFVYPNKQKPAHAYSDYSKNIDTHTDIYYDSTENKIYFLMGCEIEREHPKGQLF